MAVEKLGKGAKMIAHSVVLMSNQVKELQAANEANEAASCRKARKGKRIQAKRVSLLAGAQHVPLPVVACGRQRHGWKQC